MICFIRVLKGPAFDANHIYKTSWALKIAHYVELWRISRLYKGIAVLAFC